MAGADIRRAERALERATQELAEVRKLPNLIGAEVVWSSHLAWRRVGEDHWLPIHNGELDASNGLYPSTHVASGRLIETGSDS